jgi:hypothetical protein
LSIKCFELLKGNGISSLIRSELLLITFFVFFVSSNNDCSTETKVVLQCNLAILDLTFIGHATHLPAELSTLSQAGGSKRMTLRDQTTAWVHNDSTSISEITLIDGFTSLTDWAEAQSFIGHKLICRKAVMKLTDLDIIRGDSSGLIDSLGTSFGHIGTDELD